MWRGEEKRGDSGHMLMSELIPKVIGMCSRMLEAHNHYQQEEYDACFCLQNKLESREELEIIVVYLVMLVVAEEEGQNELENVRKYLAKD